MNAQQGYIGKSAVSIAKHANWGLTKSIAKEFGRNGITCNIISPGTMIFGTGLVCLSDSELFSLKFALRVFFTLRQQRDVYGRHAGHARLRQ